MMISLINGPRIELNGSSHSAEPIDIRRARDFIHQYYADKVSLARAARAANISAGHLSEKFKQVTGIKFVNYVGWVRVEQACQRLRESNAPISEIAFEVGFQSLSQFNRVFKKVSDKSPSEYRASFRPESTLGRR